MQTKKSTAGVLKRCLSGFLAVAAVASSGIFLNPLKAEAASPNVLSNSERGVIYANSRTDFRDESIYFMIVTRFYNGDESNDVQCWDGTQYNLNDPAWRGDFKGVIEKLDYIKALGFTSIWITPVVENCSGYDYHGYHAFDMSKVDPRYESNDCTYQDLIDACHAKGMKVIQDVVFNHTGNFGERNLVPMFTKEGDLSSVDCLKRLPNSGLPDNYESLLPARQYAARLALMKNTDGVNHDVNNLYHHFGNFNWDDYTCQIAQIAGDCVDLNTENPIVYNYLVDTYSKYIDMGVDAFRVDTTRHISRLTFNKVFNNAFKAAGERNGKDFFMFGEVCTRDNGNVWYRQSPSMSTPFYTWKDTKDYPWSDTDWEVNYESAIQNTKDNSDNISEQPSSQNALLDGNDYHTPDYSQFSGLSVIDFPMHWSFKTAESAFQVAKNGDTTYNDATWNVTYVDSHDYAPDGAPENKRFDQDQSTWAENLSLMFTFRGIPCIYYGSEIEFKKGAPIDVGPNAPLEDTGRAYYGDNIEGTITATDFGVYGNVSGAVADTLMHPLSQHIQRLNRIRQAIPALRKGQYSTEGCSGKLSFKRRYTDDKTDSFVCVTISGDSTFTGIPNGKYVDAITGDVQNVTDGTLTASVSGKGNMKVYVLDTAKTPAPGRIITNGDYLTDGGAAEPIAPEPIEVVPVTGISVSKSSVSILEGNSEKVTAKVTPDNATNKIVTWTSSNPAVATVAGGKITGVSVGTATITVKTSNGLTATVSVKVSENPNIIKPTGITISPTTATVMEGKETTLTATVTPSNATNKDVTWTSSNTSVATVSMGKVIGVAEGTAVITATTSNGKTATATVTVTGKKITYLDGDGIYFEKPSGWGSDINAYLFSNDQTVGAAWPGTAMKDLGDGLYGLEYDTTDSNLMVIFNDGTNQTGDLKYVKNGYYNSTGYVKTVGKVEAVKPTGITLDKASLSLNANQTAKLTATVTPANATNKTVVWTSSDNSVATVSNGVVTAVSAGTATITATTSNGLTATAKVTVAGVVTTELKNASTISATAITKGQTVTMTASATGGAAPYKYRYFCKPEGASGWTALTRTTTATSYTHKPARAISYQYAVKVADSKGKTSTKYFTVKVSAPATLKNASTISATAIKKGQTVTMTAKATGGTAPYKYRYFCKPEGASGWTALTKTTTATSFTHKPARAISYQYAVKIADSKGKTSTKYFTIKVSAAATLKNASTISATSITKGQTVTMTAKATNGTAPYKYRYFCKPEGASGWTALTRTTTATSYTHKPARAISYQYAVKVADSTGKTVTKYFTVTVK